ncbi:MAG TPA: DUF4178 domain-containing protein [Pyrinomonadaceae bacterium]|nr:DUF4178 domain-containing protein [Pyrinomonadaceae bacterium]
MSAIQANCPACGAEVRFKSGASVVVVCEYCNSAVARTDRGLEDLGRVAEVSESESPLEVGMRGVFRETAFELTGRAQLGHSSGGTWDEWYATFADGRTGWLAEAQGRFYMTYRTPRPVAVPRFEQLAAGQVVPGIPVGVPLVVAEKGEARALAVEGEIPYRLAPGETYLFADLSGQGGTFATIDYGDEPPGVYVGREIKLAELGLADPTRKRERAPRTVSAAQLSCPQCGGPLELRAPDKTERVACPNCGSLLDVNRGQLRYLKTLQFVGNKPEIPLGAQAEFEGRRLTVVGFMTRSVEFEGVRYFWQEYLLYEPQAGFRWLVQSDGHWSYVRPVAPGEVSEDEKRARFGGRSFKKFQEAWARVEYVAGEFYWKVEAGERAWAVDYVNAPDMLSKEVSRGVAPAGGTLAEEVNWSHGVYLPRREVERLFGLKDLPRPRTVAPNQPFPHKRVYRYWLLLTFVLLLVGVAVLATSPRRKVFERSYSLQPTASPTPANFTNAARPATPTRPTPRVTPTPAPTPIGATVTTEGEEKTQVIFTEPFELKGRENVRVTGRADVDNNWLYVAGDLINEETGLVQQFDLPIEYYYGVEDGEAWAEGGREDGALLSALPAGRYTMRLEAQWEKWEKPTPPQLAVRVEQGVPRFLNLFLALVVVSLLPLVVLFRHLGFERRRWADSAFNPYESSE